MAPIARTSSGLRDALFDEMDALRNGQSNPNRAIAVAKIACQVINSVKMEIEYQKHVAASPSKTDFVNGGAALRLGLPEQAEAA